MKQNDDINALWQPPPYHIRVSHKAKRLRFRISPKKGLEVVLPAHESAKGLDALLFEHRLWIDKHLSRMAPITAHASTTTPQITLPTLICLRALEQTWQIETIHYFGKAKVIERPQNNLALLCSQDDEKQGLSCLQQWIRDKAKETLLPWLLRLSQELALPYQRATIRAQQARWGSCSEDKAITLNLKCLFFPPALTRYVMIHELCHTLHLNHSRDFWACVERYDPDYKRHDKLLKKEREFIPDWLA